NLSNERRCRPLAESRARSDNPACRSARMASHTSPFPGQVFRSKAPNLRRTQKCNRTAETPAGSYAQARWESGMHVQVRIRAASARANCREADAANRTCSEDKCPDRHGPKYKRARGHQGQV